MIALLLLVLSSFCMSARALAPLDDDARFLAYADRMADDPDVAAYRSQAATEPYHLQAELYADIARQLRRWPGRIQPERLGESLEGQPLWAFTVQDPGTPVRYRFLVFANIHALEWVGTEVALALLLDLSDRPPPGVAVTILPVLNPDGRRKAEGDLRAGRSQTYRRGNSLQVDLNRDFAQNREAHAIWRHILPGRYAVSPAPLSQPESQAIDRLGARGFDAAVSLHAFGGYHFLPWTGRWQRPEDWPQLHALGRTLQAGQGAGAYKVMQLSRWGFFFRGHGMEIDHLYGRYGIPSVLIELTRSGITGPRDLSTPFRWYNPRNLERHVDSALGALRAVAWEMERAARTGAPLAWEAP